MDNFCQLKESDYLNSLLNKYINNYGVEKTILDSAIYLREKNVGLHRLLSVIQYDLVKLLKSDVFDPPGLFAREIYKSFLKNNMVPLINDIINIIDTIRKKTNAIFLKTDLEDRLIDAISNHLFKNDTDGQKSRILYEEILKYVFIYVVSKWGIQIHDGCRPYKEIHYIINDIFNVVLYSSIFGYTSKFFAKRIIPYVKNIQDIQNHFTSENQLNIEEIIDNFINNSNKKVTENQILFQCINEEIKDAPKRISCQSQVEFINQPQTQDFFKGTNPICKKNIIKECKNTNNTDMYRDYNKSKIINQVKEGCYLAKLIAKSEYNLSEDNLLNLKELIDKLYVLDSKILDTVQKYLESSETLNKFIKGDIVEFGFQNSIKLLDQYAKLKGSNGLIDFLASKYLPTWGLSPNCDFYKGNGNVITGPKSQLIPNDYRIKCSDLTSIIYNNKEGCEKENYCHWKSNSVPNTLSMFNLGGVCEASENKKDDQLRSLNFIKHNNDKWLCFEYIIFNDFDTIYEKKFIGKYNFDSISKQLILTVEGYCVTNYDYSYYNSSKLRSFSLDSELLIDFDCQKKIFAKINNKNWGHAEFLKINLSDKNQKDQFGNNISLCYQITLEPKMIINKKSYYLNIIFNDLSNDSISKYLKLNKNDKEKNQTYIVERDTRNDFYKWLFQQNSLICYLSKDIIDIEHIDKLNDNPNSLEDKKKEEVGKKSILHNLIRKAKNYITKKITKASYTVKSLISLNKEIPKEIPKDYFFFINIDKNSESFIVPKMCIIPSGEIEYIEYFKLEGKQNAGRNKSKKVNGKRNKSKKVNGKRNKSKKVNGKRNKSKKIY